MKIKKRIAYILHVLHGHWWKYSHTEERFAWFQEWEKCAKPGCTATRIGNITDQPFRLPPQ